MDKKVDIFLIKFTDPLLGEVLASDVRIMHNSASVADFLQELDRFAAENIADCRGCDGCCQERAPLIAADIPALSALLPETPFPVHAACRHFAELTVDDGVADITLRRNADNFCCQLHEQERYCTIWPARLFVCRSHFCLPRSERFEQLRAAIVNMGENELTRLLVEEESRGAAPLTAQPLTQLLSADDYPRNPQSDRYDYAQISLHACLEAPLWDELTQP